MKPVAKILKMAAILIGSVLLILFSLSLIMQNKVAGMLLQSLNNRFSTKIETGSYRLSLIKKFPNASVELKDVIVYSSPAFDKSGFNNINTDTLLSAKSASIDFRMIDMLKKEYTFSRINIKSGNVYLFTDKSGDFNYDISTGKDKSDKTDNVTLNLNRINLADVIFEYNDLRADFIIRGIFKEGHIRSKIQGNDIDFDGDTRMVFSMLQISGFSVKHDIPADLEIGLNQNDKGIFFRKSIMRIENWDFILTGFIASDNYMDLNVSSDNIDISKITNLIPGKYKELVSAYDPRGKLNFDWKIKGKSTSDENPHYDITWSIKNARIDNRKSDLRIDRFSFNGLFTNGSSNKPETSSFTISDFTTRLGSADYRGSFSVKNFSSPIAELSLKGKLILSELKEFLNLKKISRAEGSVDLDIKFSGPCKTNSFKFRDVFDLGSQSEVVFNSAGITFDNRPVEISGMTGRLLINENAITDNFRFSLNNHKTIISGNFRNFPGWLAGNHVILSGNADIASSILRPESFMKETENAGNNAEGEDLPTPFILPDDINLEVNFKFDTLVYKAFYAGNISGTLSLLPRIMNFRTMTMNSLEGLISGNGLVVQNPDNTFIGRGSYVLNNVDVHEAFKTFNNFGQNFLKAENIAGTLSGKITLVLPVDSLLNPDVKSVTAEGSYSLTNGALIDFDPVLALSSFIELSELQNIKFEKLENDFFIRDNVFYVPQMEIKSSAADLSVNGVHSFDNNFEYHVKMLLSEILSNKARKNRKLSDEFGEVEDDGLGRTSVFLKITGSGEDVDVAYDMKAAGDQIRESIKEEKKNLKTIINEEYGLYKENSDQEKRESTRPRFRIEWDGLDSTAVEEEPVRKRKENFLNRIFRKN